MCDAALGDAKERLQKTLSQTAAPVTTQSLTEKEVAAGLCLFHVRVALRKLWHEGRLLPQGFAPDDDPVTQDDAVWTLTPATAPSEKPEAVPLAGGLYEQFVTKPLGRGGGGVVYLGRQVNLDRLVALKILSPERVKEAAERATPRKRLIREYKVLAQLNHPNIVTLIDAGGERDDESPYLVMEYIESPTLYDLVVKNGPLAPLQAAKAMLQIANGLAYAHGRRVIHRDIKHSNIFMTPHGAKVADFGLVCYDSAGAKGPDAESSITRDAPLFLGLGTPAFQAPERHSGKGDHRSDIYSFGITFYWALTGKYPFNLDLTRTNVTEWIYSHRHVDDEAVDLRHASRRPDCPERLAQVLRRCMKGAPEARYPTWADLLPDLESVVRHLEPKTTQAAAAPSSASTSPLGGSGSADVMRLLSGLEGAASSVLRPAPAPTPPASLPETIVSKTLAELVAREGAFEEAAGRAFGPDALLLPGPLQLAACTLAVSRGLAPVLQLVLEADSGKKVDRFQEKFLALAAGQSVPQGTGDPTIPTSLTRYFWDAHALALAERASGDVPNALELVERVLLLLEGLPNAPELAPFRVPAGAPAPESSAAAPGPSAAAAGADRAPSKTPTKAAGEVRSRTQVLAPTPAGVFHLPPGTQVGPYEVRRHLGGGGMGDVYLAWDPRFEREVALKVLKAAFGQDAEYLKRFERETKIAAQLNHANIVHVYDTLTYEGLPCLVMAYIPGTTLSGVLHDREALPPEEALKIARQVADALVHAHRQGLVHRDIKPDNILLQADAGTAVLTDFGLMKSVRRTGLTHDEAGTPPTGEGLFLGTPDYASPEQARALDLDPRTDLYSLGVVLYEMLSGKRPYLASSPSDLLLKIADDREAPTPLARLQPGLDPRLLRLVDRCLAKKPEGRWLRAEDLRDEIDRILSDRDALAVRPGRARRRRALALTLAVLGAASIAWAFWPPQKSDELRKTGVFEVARPKPPGVDGVSKSPETERIEPQKPPGQEAIAAKPAPTNFDAPRPEAPKPEPLPAKIPDVRAPEAKPLEPSPSREEARTDRWVAGYRVSPDELQLIRKTLAVLDRRDAEVQRHVYAGALADLASVRKDPGQTPYTLLVLDAEVERLREVASLREAFLAKLKPGNAAQLRLTDGRSVPGVVEEVSESGIRLKLADPAGEARQIPWTDVALETLTAGAGAYREILFLATHGKPLASIALLEKHLDPRGPDDYLPELLPHAPGLVHAVALRAIASLKPGDPELARTAEEKLASLETVLPPTLRYALDPRATLGYEIRAAQALERKRYEEVLTEYELSRAYPTALRDILETFRAKASKERLGGAQFESWDKVPFEADYKVRGEHIYWVQAEKCWVLDQAQGARRTSRAEPRAASGYVFEHAFSPAPLAPSESSGWVLFLTDTTRPEHFQLAANEGHLVLNVVPRAGGEPKHVGTYSFKVAEGFRQLAVVPVGKLVLLYYDGKPAFKIAPKDGAGLETKLQIVVSGGKLKLRSLKACPSTDE